MSIYYIFERAFHPDEGFGLGGFGFKGDNRKFSFMDDGASSRVWSMLEVDTSQWQKEFDQTSDEFIVESDPSKAPTYLGNRYEGYDSVDTRPTGVARVSGGPPVADGIQSLTIQIATRGKNHAFPTEYIADLRGGTGVDRLYDWLGGESIPMNPESRLLIPDLDVQVGITLLIDRHRKKMSITSNLTGDGFPNSEVFIHDNAGGKLMLNTHHRIGSAAGQLIGNHRHLLAATQLTIDIDDAGNFGDSLTAVRCVDFMPWDTDLLEIAGTTSFSLANWNGLHIARDPTEEGIFGLDTDDALPIPGADHRWPRDRRDAGLRNLFDEPALSDLPHWNH
ncbi:hypothetical protein [Tritonibacter scottomollicae]|uniref:hypothetical protein n=1 Tax=Tritonibacter scottomollicae TaxID=483013 RepID=UPI003AA7AFB5